MKKKAEKLVHTRELNLYFDGLHDLSFSDAIEELKEAEKAALEEVRIYGYTDEFIGFKIKSIVDDMYRVEAMFQETDESYKKRLKREKDFDKKQKQLELQREREEYERLKKKFEEA